MLLEDLLHCQFCLKAYFIQTIAKCAVIIVNGTTRAGFYLGECFDQSSQTCTLRSNSHYSYAVSSFDGEAHLFNSNLERGKVLDWYIFSLEKSFALLFNTNDLFLSLWSFVLKFKQSSKISLFFIDFLLFADATLFTGDNVQKFLNEIEHFHFEGE